MISLDMLRRQRIWADKGSLMALCLVMCLALAANAAVSSDQVGVTDQEITIGAPLPLTGKIAYKGVPIAHAVSAYFADVNSHGGINGRKLRLLFCDDKYDPDIATECFNKSLKDKVFAAGFFCGSATIVRYLKYAEMARTHQMPMVGFLTGTPAAYEFRHNVFVCRPSYISELELLLDEFCKAQPGKRIALLYQNDSLGAACRLGAAKALQKFNQRLVAEASYSRDKRDVEPALTALMAANPDAVILGTSSADVPRVIEFKNQHNWKTLLLGLSHHADVIPRLGNQANDYILSQVLPPLDDSYKPVAQYHKLLKQDFPGDTPDVSGLEAWMNAMVLVEGLKRAGQNLTREKFIRAMETIRGFDVGLGPDYLVSFSPTVHVGCSNKSIYVAIVHDGKIQRASFADLKAATATP